ncbi:MAG: cyclic nucleotide-binding domain-containing protein [Spirochaetes bacterium]|nr:MAG: cyclic nucleotide-binding domain-containing protein [Spirochaetota bacterium]
MSEFDKFKNIVILKGISDDQAQILLDICIRHVFEKGEIIMQEEEDRHSMFFFIEGEVAVSNVITMKASNRLGYSEVEKSLVRLKAEQVGMLGEMSLFEEQPRSATVKAFEPCVLYEIEKKEFEGFIMRHPLIGSVILYNIANILCARIRNGNRDILKLTTALSIALSRSQ